MKGLWDKITSSKTSMLVAGFIVLALLAFGTVSAVAQELSIEAGPTVNNVHDGTSLWLESRWLDAGPGDADVAVGIFLVTESTLVRDGRKVPTQAGVYAGLSDTIGPIAVGLGVTYQKNDNIVVADPFRFTLMVGYETPKSWWRLAPDRIAIRHNSNAGSAYPNSGWDFVTLAWFIR